ncbi:ribonuclease E, partial [Blastopirellula marina]
MNRTERIERMRELLQGEGMFPVAVPDSMIEAAVDRFEAANKPLQKFTSVEMLEQANEVEWLVPGVLSRGAPAVICGPSKCLKTSLAVDLAAALSTGCKFLGKFALRRTFRVGFFSGEQAKRSLIDLTRRWMTSKQREEAPRFVCALHGASTKLETQLRQLRAWIGSYELQVVMIDPLDVAAKSKRAHTLHLQAMIRCCLECGATPILCCATRKSIRPRALDVTDLQSAGCHELARQWLLVNRRQGYQLGTGKHPLWLTVGGDAGQDDLWGVDV